MKGDSLRSWALICLWFVLGTTKATVVKPTSTGGLETHGAEFEINAYTQGWQRLNVRGSWKNIQDETRKFQLVQNGQTIFEGESLWKSEGEYVVGNVQLLCTQNIKMQSLSLALQIPLSTNKGHTWTVDSKHYTIPTGKSQSGDLTVCTVPLPDNKSLTVSFDQPIHYLEQDLSQWSDNWSLRFGKDQDPRTFEKGEKIDFRLKLKTSDGIELKQLSENIVVEEGTQWVRLHNHKDIVAGSALDFSTQKLQDAPAGKWGWLKAVDGTFEFEKKPGKAQRFYGVNLCFTANYPTHEVADQLADRLVRLGYNTIRVHHHDDTWAQGDSEMRDRLDYLLASVMRRGLYVTTDIYVSRKVSWKSLGVDREGDVGMDLFKSLIGCFEPAYQNWCDFAKEFMEHKNPYTGRMYKDEPGMPLISLVNEGELFMGFDSKAKEPLIQQAYQNFIGKDEQLEYGTPGFNAFGDWLETRIAERCSAYLRSIGVKALLTNDNNGFKHGDGESTTPLYDYVDNHFYIDHPSFLDKNWQLPSRCENTNPVCYGGPDILRKNYAKGFAKPYTITEWNFSGPGKYRGLGGILTGAKAAIQDWDGLWRFAYSHSRESLLDDENHYPGYFDVATDPLSQASDRASICLFLRGDAQAEDELEMDSKTGVLKLNTARTCGIYAPEGIHSAGVLTADISGVPGTICLSSLDNKSLQESKHMLLSHITDVQGAGTVYADSDRKILLKWGIGTLLERGKAQITIDTKKARKLKVYELDTAGNRVRRLNVQTSEGSITFTVSTDNEDGEGRIYYEVTTR